MALSINKSASLLVISFLAAMVVSCNKEKTANDKTGPSISVHSPSSGQQFSYLDTVLLSADISDESEIQDVTVSVITPVDTTEIWPAEPVIFGNVTSYSLDDFVVDGFGVASPTDVIMRFSATDKHENSNHVDVSIQLQ